MINAKKVSRSFKNTQAIKSVSFNLNLGEIIGLLGPNGAGKTTLMKMMAGILHPSSGKILIGGKDITEDMEFKKNIGYMPENSALYDDMTVHSYLKFIAQTRGVLGKNLESCIIKAAIAAKITDIMHKRIEALSKGYKRRVSLTQAIIHDPKILILDEPTEGFDPNQKIEFYDLIKKLSPDRLIIISTHILEEVRYVCNRVLLINKGEIALDAPASEMNDHQDKNINEVFYSLTKGEKE